MVEKEQTEKKEVGEVVESNKISEEDIKNWDKTGKIVEEAAKRKEKIESKFRKVQLKREELLGRAQKPYEILVNIDEDEDGTVVQQVFRVRRLTPKESADLRVLPEDPNNPTREELEALNDIDFKILEKTIIEPEGLDIDTLKKLDSALIEDLKIKVGMLNTYTNDAELVDHLKNLLTSQVTSN